MADSKALVWETATNEEKKELAVGFLQSFRGAMVVGQALYIASQVLSNQKNVLLGEPSNGSDMELIGEWVYSFGYQQAKETHARNIQRIAEKGPGFEDGEPGEEPFWKKHTKKEGGL